MALKVPVFRNGPMPKRPPIHAAVKVRPLFCSFVPVSLVYRRIKSLVRSEPAGSGPKWKVISILMYPSFLCVCVCVCVCVCEKRQRTLTHTLVRSHGVSFVNLYRHCDTHILEDSSQWSEGWEWERTSVFSELCIWKLPR